jgi:hypothetical protein
MPFQPENVSGFLRNASDYDFAFSWLYPLCTKESFMYRISTLLIAVSFGLVLCADATAVPFSKTTPLTKNIAATAIVTVSETLAGAPSRINDADGTSQIDVGPSASPGAWVAYAWPNSPQNISRLFMEQIGGYAQRGYEIQVAKVGVTNPNGANAADWETVPGGTFAGQSTSQAYAAVAPAVDRTGVRILVTDNANVDGRLRLRELWAFSNYNNIAPSATVSAPGWTGGTTANLSDEATINGQLYTSNYTANPNVTFTWNDPQLVGGVLIHGGSGAPNERLIDYVLQQRDITNNWVNLMTITGNTQKSQFFQFSEAIETDGFRIVVNSADAGNGAFARIGEVFIFGVDELFAPEPNSGVLMGMGLVGLLVRRRKRNARPAQLV